MRAQDRVLRWGLAGSLCAMAIGAAYTAWAGAEDGSKAGAKYLRLLRADGEPVALQTSIVRFTSAKPELAGVTADLIGAVHVGEPSYYQSLNDEFAKYDVVLYELVAPAGTRVPKGTSPRNDHPVGALQNGLKGMLNLEHQLEHVDYTKENLVHADMSPDDFFKSMENKNESVWSLFFRMMGAGMAQQAKRQAQGKGDDFEILLALFDPNRSVALKRVMAEQFEDLEGMMTAVEGPDGTTLIAERNKVALEGLTRQIAAGKKKIAVFYGAGHLPDMEKRLVADGFTRGEERWLTAWDMHDPAGAKKKREAAPATAK
jgi:hypothetical protein